MPGGGGQQSQTTQVQLSPQQEQLFGLAMPFLRQFARNPPELPEGRGVVGFNGQQRAGQQSVLNAIPGMRDTVNSAASGNRFLTSGDVLSPDSNPALRAHMEGATRPIIDNLMENILPTVRGGAATTGNYGSTRQGVAEGISTGKALNQVGDTTAQIANTAYGQGLDAMTKGIGLSGQIAQNLTLPGQARSAVGDTRQAMSQRILDDARYRFMYPQQLPLMMGQTLAGIASGMPTAGTSTFASGSQPNLFSQILGGASTLGSLFAGGGNSAMSGLTALLPFLSDRREKTNIKEIGRAFDGTPLYIYRYRMEPHKDVIGPMADELPERFVYEREGLKYIRAREWAQEMENSNGSIPRADVAVDAPARSRPDGDGELDAVQSRPYPSAHGSAGHRSADAAADASSLGR